MWREPRGPGSGGGRIGKGCLGPEHQCGCRRAGAPSSPAFVILLRHLSLDVSWGVAGRERRWAPRVRGSPQEWELGAEAANGGVSGVQGQGSSWEQACFPQLGLEVRLQVSASPQPAGGSLLTLSWPCPCVCTRPPQGCRHIPHQGQRWEGQPQAKDTGNQEILSTPRPDFWLFLKNKAFWPGSDWNLPPEGQRGCWGWRS